MMLEASAGPLLRHRKHWGAENIKIFADVQKNMRPMPSPMIFNSMSWSAARGFVDATASL